MKLTRLFTGAVKLTGLLIAIRFGLLEGILLSGKPDPQMLLTAAFMLTGAEGVEAFAKVVAGKRGGE